MLIFVTHVSNRIVTKHKKGKQNAVNNDVV